ncbi:hypothetical protein ACT2CR_00470 [Candidatus Vidania fulgoroideorum]
MAIYIYIYFIYMKFKVINKYIIVKKINKKGKILLPKTKKEKAFFAKVIFIKNNPIIKKNSFILCKINYKNTFYIKNKKYNFIKYKNIIALIK